MNRTRVEHAVALPYAERVLRDGRIMARIIRATVDLDEGWFEATADFQAFGPHDWEITTTGAAQNRVPDASKERGWRSDFEAPLRDWLAPPLLKPGRGLIVENWHVGPRRTADAPRGVRFTQAPVGDEFESYLMVVGPVDDGEPVDFAVRWGPPHWNLGALIGTERVEAPLPNNNDVLEEETLALLLADVRGMYMRMASYDGYLIWRRNEPAA